MTMNQGTLGRAHQWASTIGRRLKRTAADAVDVGERMLASVGARHDDVRIASDAQAYWTGTSGTSWQDDSHWRGAPVFGDPDLWDRIGAQHLDLFEAGARMSGFQRPWRRVVEWGCGGGANAVHFAPRAEEFIGVDISTATLDECARQVRRVCDSTFTPVAIDVMHPEAAVPVIGGDCDIFLSFYVFELIPSPEYGERLLRIAHQILAPGGLALIQVKYDPGRWRTRSRRRAYQRRLADMTTYRTDEFWQLAARNGFVPQAVHLVPENELDRRYAYFVLVNGEDEGVASTDAAGPPASAAC